jgi:hypothetical protein
MTGRRRIRVEVSIGDRRQAVGSLSKISDFSYLVTYNNINHGRLILRVRQEAEAIEQRGVVGKRRSLARTRRRSRADIIQSSGTEQSQTGRKCVRRLNRCG